MKTSGWKTATIAASGTTSGAVDLGQAYKSLAMFIPTITVGTLALQTAMTSDGTYQNLYAISTTDGDDDQILCSSGTGAFNLVVPFFGFQHLKFVAATQSGAVTIYVCGFS